MSSVYLARRKKPVQISLQILPLSSTKLYKRSHSSASPIPPIYIPTCPDVINASRRNPPPLPAPKQSAPKESASNNARARRSRPLQKARNRHIGKARPTKKLCELTKAPAFSPFPRTKRSPLARLAIAEFRSRGSRRRKLIPETIHALRLAAIYIRARIRIGRSVRDSWPRHRRALGERCCVVFAMRAPGGARGDERMPRQESERRTSNWNGL